MEPIQRVADFIKNNDDFVVACHHDADGLSSGAITALTLKRLNKKFVLRPNKQLDDDFCEKIKNDGKHFIFVDFGSGQLDVVSKHFSSFAIIDHHETMGETQNPHFNAHMLGLDGAKEISGSGCCYLVAKQVNEKNVDLSALAIIGAVGDMQDSNGALVGFNRNILEDAVNSGKLVSMKDIRLFGRHSRPLVQFLLYASDPIFPGITANEEGVKRFLNELSIPMKVNEEWVYYVDLSDEEKQKLVSALFVYGKQHFIPDFLLKSLIGEVYELAEEPMKGFTRDVKDFATLLNACGRHEKGLVGLKVLMGDRADYYQEAEDLIQMHRKLLRKGIEFAKKQGIEEHEKYSVLDAGNAIQDTLIGVIAGMLYGAQVIPQDKPIIAFSDSDEGLKVSGRATWALVRKGLHLGTSLRTAAKAVGGDGGGHSIAAGAHIPKEKKKEFLEELDKII